MDNGVQDIVLGFFAIVGALAAVVGAVYTVKQFNRKPKPQKPTFNQKAGWFTGSVNQSVNYNSPKEHKTDD